ncbi:type II secretion system protein [Oceanobacillus rekensis]|uniref:type II secretion system protein n=1 Tax=Oceanobacillus rekensis TaxID=937927 RepID=UPI0015945F1F|nr:type II secretion system protein [Oceanobacillus rekensis]
MRKDNGFTLIEVLVAASILFMTVSTFLPIILILDAEQKVLSDRRHLTHMLHDELQYFIWNPSTEKLPSQFTETVHTIPAKFEFSIEKQLIKGCVEWNNAKNRKEEICLYGIQTS